jgi:hypothetical protein
VSSVAEGLRPGGLDELAVVPAMFGDRMTHLGGFHPPDLRKVPEAMLVWSGPLEYSARIARSDAERRRAEAGVPVLLHENWGERFLRPDGPPRIPTPPRGRDADLGEVLDGIVVVGDYPQVLEQAWGGADGPDPLAELLGAIPADASDPAAFLRGAAEGLRKLAAQDGAPAWAHRLPAVLEDLAETEPPPHRVAVVPFVPGPLRADGVLDEPAWARAATIPTDIACMSLRVVSNGNELAVALRLEKGCPRHEVAVVLADPPALSGFTYGKDGLAFVWQDGHVVGEVVRKDGVRVAEVLFDTFALGGDPYPTRTFHLKAGVQQAWEDARQLPVRLLVVGR